MKFKKIIIFLLFFLTSFFCLGKESFIIDRYDIVVNVNENNSYLITEIIELTFYDYRRGIIRDIPLKFNNQLVKISNISVDGHKIKIKKSFNDLSIRIGEPKKQIIGKQLYKISYTLDVGSDNNSEFDEFYLNLIGDKWDTDITEATFEINMPFDFNYENLNFTSGYFEETDNTNVYWEVNNNKIKGYIKNPLESNQALTVYLSLPEGYWINTKKHISILNMFLGISGIVSFFIIFILWYIKGKNKKIYPRIEYYPPENLTSAEIGYILDGVVDNIDVISLILSLADKGFLNIEEKDNDMILYKIKEMDNSTSHFEKYLFKKLFKNKKKVNITELRYELNNNFYNIIETIKEKIYEKYSNKKLKEKSNKNNNFMKIFEEENREIKEIFNDSENKDKIVIFEKISFKLKLSLILISIFPILLVFYYGFTNIPPSEIDSSNILGGIIFICTVVPLYVISYIFTIPGRKKDSLIFITSLILLFSAGSFYFTAVSFAGIPFVHYFLGVLSTYISFSFLHLFSLKRTNEGLKIYERIIGFKKFIKNSNKEDIDNLFQEDSNYFFKIFPYSLVMGLTKKWASNFEDLLTEAPKWYENNRKEKFFIDRFSDNIDKMTVYYSQAPSSSSSTDSSSSSEGGSSGGGAGGGGGSSW